MEQIINKAIEGGYKNATRQGYEINWEYSEMVLHPSFWKSLSKALKWEDNWYQSGEGWKENALSFYEINLIEGWDKAVLWLEDLLTNPK